MKCEMIRDLLPLYIDGLTSEASNQKAERAARRPDWRGGQTSAAATELIMAMVLCSHLAVNR